MPDEFSRGRADQSCPQLMMAARLHSLGGPESVVIEEIPLPAVLGGQALVRVVAAGLSHSDLLRAQGRYQEAVDLPFVVGGELAGRIVTAPPWSGLRPGDPVAAVVGTGAVAEYAAVPVGQVLPLPQDLPLSSGAAAPLNFLTARFALMDRGGLRPGEDVVVLGGGGGIGTAAIQLARLAGAGSVAAVASSPERRATAAATGADPVLAPEELAGRRATADVLLDPVGGAFAIEALGVLRDFGRHVVVGFAGGQVTAPKLNRAVFRNLSHVGAGWGAFAEHYPDRVRASWLELAEHLAAGRLRAVIGAEGHIREVPDLLRRLADRRVPAKTVVAVQADTT
ncbi:zinc-binding dehydrogenase [Sinomonas susongensis]|uniref:zinc-binding dehydrogenase n=1 Tax=Sinomonas susongensis TaxID=1324851 RepID=UPI001109898F|nr:zinc-binding dehydrogenase [Sinomonas susongensis]